MKEKKERQKFFDEALSDFTHDVSSGRAIRHLTDLGYTTDQILTQLDYPTPRGRIMQTVTRHLMDLGILIDVLPIPQEQMKVLELQDAGSGELYRILRKKMSQDGEKAWFGCPFGMIRRDREARLEKMLSCLTGREKEYLLGIDWEMCMMYHQLNSRMIEIGVQLAVCSETEFSFYFTESREIIINRHNK